MPPRLGDLGERICILGPSNSGKSTLAAAIGRSQRLPVVHIDQLHHLPNSDWVPRPGKEFLAAHDAAISEDRWVMEGNYPRCLPQRLTRATGLILIGIPMPLALVRYFRRTLIDTHRFGGLEGGTERLSWTMIRYVTIVGPLKRRRYRAQFDASPLPKLFLNGADAVSAFYEREGLTRNA